VGIPPPLALSKSENPGPSIRRAGWFALNEGFALNERRDRMRKFLLMALAGLALALAAPVTASAAPTMNGEAIRTAADGVSTTETVAWHCRRRSVWCAGRPYYRYHVYPRYRYRYYRPYRSYYYAPRYRYYRYY
jgi:hypothetical protein